MLIAWKDKSFWMSNFLIKNLDNYIDGVMNKKTSAVFLFDGRSGLGKTTFSFQVGCYIAKGVAKHFSTRLKKEVEPKFSLDDVAWTPDAFIDKLKKATKGDIIILDESMILSNRSSMSEVNRMVIIMMSMIRSKQIFVMFNVNSIFDLEKNLPLHRADMLVHLYAPEDRFASRGRYGVVPSAKGKLKNLYILGKKYYDYSRSKYAFIDKFPAFFPFDEKEYEKRKQESISAYFESATTTSNKSKDSRDTYIRHLKESGMSHEVIAGIGGISTKTVQRALKD